VHPGYGFLSERASFCEALEKEGIAFIGPKVKAIEAMGDKITSKKIAPKAGVHRAGPYGPDRRRGACGEDRRRDRLSGDDQGIAGGGGKGMRIAWNDDEAREGFPARRTRRRRVWRRPDLHREIHRGAPPYRDPGDRRQHGNAVYLGERECSIQRRNQKVVEEAPSPFLDEATRKAMGEQSVALAKAVDYQSPARWSSSSTSTATSISSR
jgi:propionyl-CoA carboxylase alpha chain